MSITKQDKLRTRWVLYRGLFISRVLVLMSLYRYFLLEYICENEHAVFILPNYCYTINNKNDKNIIPVTAPQFTRENLL